jgi:hypothetical protein
MLLAASSSSISSVIRVSSNCPDLNRFPIAVALQINVHPVNPIPRDGRASHMIAERAKDFLPVYSSWFGKPVVMRVVIRQCHLPMPCLIVGESAADVRVRINPGWEMDIRKDLILAVEEVVIATGDPVN